MQLQWPMAQHNSAGSRGTLQHSAGWIGRRAALGHALRAKVRTCNEVRHDERAGAALPGIAVHEHAAFPPALQPCISVSITTPVPESLQNRLLIPKACTIIVLLTCEFPYLGDESIGALEKLRDVVLLVVVNLHAAVPQFPPVEARHDGRSIDHVGHAERLQRVQIPRRANAACN